MHSSSSRLMPGDQAALPQLQHGRFAGRAETNRLGRQADRVGYYQLLPSTCRLMCSSSMHAGRDAFSSSKAHLVRANDDRGVARPLLAADAGRLGRQVPAGSLSSAGASAAGSASASSSAATCCAMCGAGNSADWLLHTGGQLFAGCSASRLPLLLSSCTGSAAGAAAAACCTTLGSTSGGPPPWAAACCTGAGSSGLSCCALECSAARAALRLLLSCCMRVGGGSGAPRPVCCPPCWLLPAEAGSPCPSIAAQRSSGAVAAVW